MLLLISINSFTLAEAPFADKILTDYSWLVVLIITAIMYFVKRIFDLKNKKREVNHSLFQQNRIDVVNRFYAVYAETVQMWNRLSVIPALNGKIDASEMGRITDLSSLDKIVLELQIYFKESDYNHFVQIKVNMDGIHRKMLVLYFDVNDMKLGEKTNHFLAFRKAKEEENIATLKKISEIIRATYS
jgi:hypothetical protein